MLRIPVTVAACILGLTAGPALAQSTIPNPDTAPRFQQPAPDTEQQPGMSQDNLPSSERMPETSASGSPFLLEKGPNETLAEQYAGAEVMLRNGERLSSIGEISFVVHDENQRIVGAVVEVGGFLGIGSRPIAVKWSHLERLESSGDTTFVLSGLTAEDVESAPEYKLAAAGQEPRGEPMPKPESPTMPKTKAPAE